MCCSFILNTLKAYDFSFLLLFLNIFLSFGFLNSLERPLHPGSICPENWEGGSSLQPSSAWYEQAGERKQKQSSPKIQAAQAQQTLLEKKVIMLTMEKCLKEENSLQMNGSHLSNSLTSLSYTPFIDGRCKELDNSLAKSQKKRVL